MHSNNIQRAFIDKVVNQLNEAVRLLRRWCFAMTTTLQLNILCAPLFHCAAVIKSFCVCQVNPKAQL